MTTLAKASATPIVALVGRPNVGKSTLFNRLARKPLAIVQDLPGLTRDRHYAEILLGDRAVTLVDTGGLEPKPKGSINQRVQEQTKLGIEEAAVVVFIVDSRAGLTAEDAAIARQLRKVGKPVILCANKAEGPREEASSAEFHRLGFPNVILISAEHGRNTKELVDCILGFLPKAEEIAPLKDAVCSIAVLGRPNVGKSSLVNRLLGEERMIASDEPGTTRDAIDAAVEHEGERYIFIDTAGLRRKARIEEQLEEQMVGSALRSLKRADVALLVLDATELATEQEAKLARVVLDHGKSLIFVINKWDLRDKKLNPQNFKEEMQRRFPHLMGARYIYCSALTGQGLEVLFPEINATLAEWRRRIATGELNRFIDDAQERHPTPMYNGKRGKIYYLSQVGIEPPTMALMVNDPERFPDAYKRYLEAQLREEFGFEGTPVVFYLRRRHGRERAKDNAAKINIPIVESIRQLEVYQPGKPIEETERELGLKDVVKLASNENPLGPSPLATEAIARVLPKLHLYPDGSGFHLKKALAAHLSVPVSDIILGNGSNEILEFVLRVTARPGGNVVIGWPSFVIYALAAQAAGLHCKRVPMPALQYDVHALLAAVDDKTSVVLIGHPSNPTGTYVPRKELEWFVDHLRDDVVVVIDEAYFEYVEAPDYVSGLELRRPNVIVLRTFSKAYGLAGLRVGYGVADAEFVGYLNRIREPFNVSTLALIGAEAALKDKAHVERCVGENAAERARISGAFEKYGCTVTPSQTNFILVDSARPAAPVYEALLKRGVITRPMKAYGLDKALRLSFGTRGENDRLIAALAEVLAS